MTLCTGAALSMLHRKTSLILPEHFPMKSELNILMLLVASLRSDLAVKCAARGASEREAGGQKQLEGEQKPARFAASLPADQSLTACIQYMEASRCRRLLSKHI